jgi:hypothetical protein
MPLLDHFRPPLATTRHWETFHGGWAYEMMRALNRGVLPPGYFSESQVHVGSRVEVDLASFTGDEGNGGNGPGANGGVAVQTWSPPLTTLVMPATFPDEIEVQVFRSSGGALLVAAVELVSPGNKDRPETRQAFAAKCATYLHAGVGLVVVDVVTERQTNLHDELMGLLDRGDDFRFPADAHLYAVSYRPSRKKAGDQIEVFPYALGVGQVLPKVPLPLQHGPTVSLDLEATYTETRSSIRLP